MAECYGPDHRGGRPKGWGRKTHDLPAPAVHVGTLLDALSRAWTSDLGHRDTGDVRADLREQFLRSGLALSSPPMGPSTARSSTRTRSTDAWPENPAWKFVAVGAGNDIPYWTEFLRAFADIDPDMAVNIEHEDAA